MTNKFKESLKNCKNAIIGNSAYEIVKKILELILGGILAPTITNIGMDLLNIDIVDTYKIPIIIIITLVVIITILHFWCKTYNHCVIIPNIKENYEILKREATFTYGKDCSKYELSLEVKSKINGLNRLPGKYTWSGSENATISCKTKHCKIIELTRKDSFLEYEIELGQTYNEGDVFKCKIVGIMPDSKHTFVPFFSTQVMESTQELIINIIIPTQYNVREVFCEELAVVRNSNQSITEQPLDDGKYSWKITKPKLFYKYSIRWEL